MFNTLIIKINKHKTKVKVAAPHGRLPHTHNKTECKVVQAWSSLVPHCRRSSFYASKVPP